MKFGTFHLLEVPEWLTESQAFHQEIEQMQYAEEIGLDEVWLTEHHFNPYGLCGDPLVVAAHVAARTKRIRIGTAISILPFQNPVRLAEQVAIVDILSSGRFDFGIGRGYSFGEFHQFNIPIQESKARFDEALDIILKSFTQERFSYQGQYYTYNDISVRPKPVQKPHPPIYVATVGTPETIKTAARNGFPLIFGGTFMGKEHIKEAFVLYEKTAREAGFSDEQIREAIRNSPNSTRIYVSETTEKAREDMRQSLQWFIDNFIAAGLRSQRPGQERVGASSYDQYIASIDTYFQRDVYGTPEYCIRRLKEFEEIGVGTNILWFTLGGLDHKKVLKSMKMFAEHVLPAFKETSRAPAKRPGSQRQ